MERIKDPYWSIVTSKKQCLNEENKHLAIDKKIKPAIIRKEDGTENWELDSDTSDALAEDSTEVSFADRIDDEQELFNQPGSSRSSLVQPLSEREGYKKFQETYRCLR